MAAPDENQKKTPSRVVVHLNVHPAPERRERKYSPRVLASPDPFFALPEAWIIWRSLYPFAIRFDHATPLRNSVEVRSRFVDGVHVAEAQIRRDANRVVPFKYTVALMFEDQVIIADPNGVVEPDPPTGMEMSGGPDELM
jgi:hypothetical protein